MKLTNTAVKCYTRTSHIHTRTCAHTRMCTCKAYTTWPDTHGLPLGSSSPSKTNTRLRQHPSDRKVSNLRPCKQALCSTSCSPLWSQHTCLKVLLVFSPSRTLCAPVGAVLGTPLFSFFLKICLLFYVYKCLQCPKRPEEGTRYNCALPCGCWRLNPGPLQELTEVANTSQDLKGNDCRGL